MGRRRLAFGPVLAIAMAAGAHAEGAVDLRALAPGSPVSGTLTLAQAGPQPGRLGFDVVLDMPSLLGEIDAAMQARGNLGGEAHRLYLLGPVTLLRAGGTSADLRLRARIEEWLVAGPLRTELLRSTHDVDVAVAPIWDEGARELRLEVTMLNAHDLPGEAEQWLRAQGVPSSFSLAIFAPDDAALAAADVQVEPVSVEPLPAGLRARLRVTADAAGAGALVGALLPEASDLASAFGGFLLGRGG